VLLAGFGGYALARKALAPIDSMATQAKEYLPNAWVTLVHRESEDELGKARTVFNDMLGDCKPHSSIASPTSRLRTPLTL